MIDGPLIVGGADTGDCLHLAARAHAQQLPGLRARSREHLRAVSRLTGAACAVERLRERAHDREQTSSPRREAVDADRAALRLARREQAAHQGCMRTRRAADHGDLPARADAGTIEEADIAAVACLGHRQRAVGQERQPTRAVEPARDRRDGRRIRGTREDTERENADGAKCKNEVSHRDPPLPTRRIDRRHGDPPSSVAMTPAANYIGVRSAQRQVTETD
jgi:hypothetical protein